MPEAYQTKHVPKDPQKCFCYIVLMTSLKNISNTNTELTQSFITAGLQYLTKYWVLAVILAVILLSVIFALIFKHKKKRALARLDDVSIRLNALKSVPLPYKVSKAVALARTKKDIEDIVAQCQKDFETVQKNLKDIQNMISDDEEFVITNKFKAQRQDIAEINARQDQTEQLVSSLSSRLDELLQKEDTERSKVNELKNVFRQLKKNINDQAGSFVFCWEALENKVTAIEAEFSAFEELMYTSEFDKAALKTCEIKDLITQLNEAIEKIPDLLDVAKGSLPVMCENIKVKYQAAVKQEVYLTHLDVESVVSSAEVSVNDCLEQIKVVDLSGVNEKLLDCEAKLTKLDQQINCETVAFEQQQSLKEIVQSDLTKLTDKAKSVRADFTAHADHYDITDWQDKLTEIDKQVENVSAAHTSLFQTLGSSAIPATTVVDSLEKLDQEILRSYSEVSNMAGAIDSASYSEERARQQLLKIELTLSETEAKIRLSRLPAVSQKYDADLAKANELIDRLQTTLATSPLNITLLNSLLSTAIDFVCKLYENVARLLGTAIMAENAIIIGNRYRSNYEDVDSDLSRAELAYHNGEYTQALSIALKAIERVYPSAVNELLKKPSAQAA